MQERIISNEQLIQVIKAGKAFVKTVCSPVGYDEPWHKLLKKIADPNNDRGPKKLDPKIDRNWVFNPKEGKWQQRDFTNKPRGAFKDTRFTKKTSVSLLPTDGVMQLFQSANANYRAGLALILNSEECDLKNEKYIFPQDINAHTKWWQKKQTLAKEKHVVHRSISLSELKADIAHKRSHGVIPKHNDLLVGLSKEAVLGILVVNNTLEDRLNAMSKKELVRRYLQYDVPVFIHQTTGPVAYSLEQQLEDIRAGEKAPKQTAANILVTQAISGKYKEFLQHSTTNLNIVDAAVMIEDLPFEISNKIFNHLDASDLTKLSKNFKMEKENELSSLTAEHLIVDLQTLLKRINCGYEVKNIPYNQMNLHQYKKLLSDNIHFISSFITDTSNIRHSFRTIKLLVDHLSYAKHPSLEDALITLLEKKEDNNAIWIIQLLMEKNQHIEVTSTHKLIGYHFQSGWMYKPNGKNEVYIEHWSILVAGMLHHNPKKMAELIGKFFPTHLASTLGALYEIQEKAQKLIDDDFWSINNECHYPMEKIEKARLSLLLIVTAGANYQTTKNDKHVLRSYFLDKIHKAKSDDELDLIAKECKSCFLLGQHRHPTFDKIYEFFFHKTKIVDTLEILAKAIEDKRITIGNLKGVSLC